MIKLTNYDKKNQKISFIADMPISLANAIRRSVLEIPVLAIDEVEITQNDSALYDEILAHRLGLVPIKTDETSKEGKLKLKETGPKTVYSTDLKPDTGTEYRLPIVILGEEQGVELVANTKLGKGVEHIKYSPGLIYYRHNLDEDLLDLVTIDEEGDIAYNEEELKEKQVPKETIEIIKKLGKAEELKFTIEAWGQIEVKKIFQKAIEVLDENLNELAKAIK
jgi:DNA-directed RNA polymerase subunit D